MTRMRWFVNNYIPTDKEVTVLDLGSQDVNGSYKQLFTRTKVKYIGVDMVKGRNVDLVLSNTYNWVEIDDNSIDYIISGNVFEHIEYPWLTMQEISNKLKKGGITCILAPFALGEHKYPTDCYRYYSDGFKALANWAGLQVIECTVGGVPKGTKDPEWFDKDQNYDDTLLIAGKDLTADEINSYPKLGSTMLTRVWKIQ